jgi:two-component system chemotaxis sensor kinase CheA
MRVRPEEIAYAATGATVIHGGEAIPYLSLAAALSLEESRSEGQPAVPFIGLVVAGESGTAMIGLDRLFGTETVVVRPLAELAAASEVVGGVSLDGEGNPRLVLDPDGLVAAAYQAGGGSAPASAEHELTHVPMLVIDDSLTSRMLEQSILESAGYTVDVAGSGEEALDKARRTRYSLFLVDVEMPGIDGYTFIERAADDVSLRDIPAIVVSSQASPEDLARGREVGARMHVDKRQFDQNELLDRIRELVA